MMIANQPTVRMQNVARNAQTPPAEAPPAPPAPPTESFGGKIGKSALKTGIAWGNATGTVVGGAGGLGVATAGLYVGVLGGAVVGLALGGGFGPVLGAVSGKGALNFLGTAFQTMGTAAKAGVVLGGLAGGAGAWSVGQAAGNVAGKVVGFPLGAAYGAVTGIGQAAEDAATGGNTPSAPSAPGEKPTAGKPSDLNKMNGIAKVAAGVVSGVGLLSGGTGGFIAGAGVASTGSLIKGLLASNVQLSTLGGAALTGGIVGAAVFGVVGGVGGWKLVKGAQHAYEFVADKIQGHNAPPAK